MTARRIIPPAWACRASTHLRCRIRFGSIVMDKINKAFFILPVVFAILIAIGILTS